MLAAIRQAQELDEWHRIEALLAGVQPPVVADDVSNPLGVLVDEVERHVELFSIVHVAEQADEREYVRGLMKVLPSLVDQAPWWSRTLLVRVLNAAPAVDALLTALGTGSLIEKQSIASVVEAIEVWRPGQSACVQ